MENRHPVDELAEIRAERRRLAEREEALRMQLLLTDADLEGDEYRAYVHAFERRELDRALLEQHFGKAVVAGCERVISYRIVALNKRTRQRRAPAPADAVEPRSLT
jgi:hypothetical protein